MSGRNCRTRRNWATTPCAKHWPNWNRCRCSTGSGSVRRRERKIWKKRRPAIGSGFISAGLACSVDSRRASNLFAAADSAGFCRRVSAAAGPRSGGTRQSACSSDRGNRRGCWTDSMPPINRSSRHASPQRLRFDDVTHFLRRRGSAEAPVAGTMSAIGSMRASRICCSMSFKTRRWRNGRCCWPFVANGG